MKELLAIVLILSVLMAGCIGQVQVIGDNTTNGTLKIQPSPLLGARCGNNVCEAGESENNCCQDCGCETGLHCVNGLCQPQCGDGICANVESQSTCCSDCGCSSGQTCQNSVCVELKPDVEITTAVFPKLYKSSTYLRSVGDTLGICVKNNGNDVAQNVQITVSSRNAYFGDKVVSVGSLAVGNEKCSEVKLDFYDAVLNIVSEIQMQADIQISYSNSVGRDYTVTNSAMTTVEGRNYFSHWSTNPNEISMYVTPNQPSVREFASKATGGLATYQNSIQQKLAARWLFANMKAYGISYVTDAHVSGDYVEFPYDTLRNKGGDCEDHAIFYSSLLEAVGITSVVILDTNWMGMGQAHAYSGYINKENQLVVVDSVYSDFDLALSAGYDAYANYGNTKTVIYPSANWRNYPQVTVPETVQVLMPYITKQVGTCQSSWDLQMGFYIYAPVTFVNSGNAPAAGCAALASYDKNRTKLSEDLSCWTVNPSQTVTKNYVADIAMSNWLDGYYCTAY